MITNPPRQIGWGPFWGALLERPRSLVFGIWFSAFSLMFLANGSLESSLPREPDVAKVLAQGRSATAEVTKVEEVTGITINGVHPLRVRFRYTAEGAVRTGFMDTLSTGEVSEWKAGRQVPIRYLADDAAIPYLKPVDFPVFLFKGMPYAFFLIGLGALAFCVAGAFRKAAILRDGVVRNGRLMAWVPVSSRFAWLTKTRFEVTYSFSGPDGNDSFGSSSTRDLAFLNERKKGDEIQVLVLEDDLKKSLAVDGPILARITAPASR